MNYTLSPRGKGRYKRSFQKRANQREAKERKRLNPELLPDEPAAVAPKLPRLKFATVTIRCGRESVSFRVVRWDARKLLCRGKVQASSTVGRRVALCLDAIL